MFSTIRRSRRGAAARMHEFIAIYIVFEQFVVISLVWHVNLECFRTFRRSRRGAAARMHEFIAVYILFEQFVVLGLQRRQNLHSSAYGDDFSSP